MTRDTKPHTVPLPDPRRQAQPGAEGAVLVQMAGITKAFTGVVAVDDVLGPVDDAAPTDA